MAMVKVGIFDSGVGGLSIFQAVSRRLSNLQLAYCSDNEFHPYGTKSDSEVAHRTQLVCRAFVQQANLDILVIACNTASTVALPLVREKLQIPVVGVIPAIKPAAGATKTGVIGLLATPATIKRPYVDELIQKFAPEIDVVRVGSSSLVALAEAKARGRDIDLEHVKREISGLFNEGLQEGKPVNRLDAVVLGCTHFPLLIDEFRAVAPWNVQWIDSGDAIASRVEYLINASAKTDNPARQSNDRVAWMTRLDGTAELLRPMFVKFGINSLVELTVSGC